MNQRETDMMQLPEEKICQLIEQLDSCSSKIAGGAMTALWINKCTDSLIDALLNERLRTSKGKVRAINVLQRFGKSLPRAIEVYVMLLGDRSYHVAHNALFGVVFWQDRSLIPKIEVVSHRCNSGKMCAAFAIAKRAIEAHNPFLFSKGFHDVKNVWQLDPKRFAKHIGPLA